jgi:P-type Cu+ transporter
METKRFDVTGMTCASCVSHVEKSVGKLDGVHSVEVQLLGNSMTVTYDDKQVGVDAIESSVHKAGYEASVREVTARKEPLRTNVARQEQDALRFRWWVSLIFLMPLFYVSMGQMVGVPLPRFLSGYSGMLAFALTQFLLTLPILYVNRNYFRGFRSLLQGSPTMDSLIAIGSSAAVVYGIYTLYLVSYAFGRGDAVAVHAHVHHLYFESAGTILTLVTLGKYLESKSKGRTTEALSKLIHLAPKTALVIRSGKETEILSAEVRVDDEVILKPGFIAPVDGVVVSGSSSMNESALTGESMPVWKKTGDRVLSAAANQMGYLTFRATRVGDDTTLSQIIHLVEEASMSKAPISRMADRISRVFVPVVIAVALVTMVVWLLMGQSFDFALSAGISVLVISCPCALGLATPVAIMVGTGKGAHHGLLFKSGAALETVRKVDVVVLDKTGTITEGKPGVSDVLTNLETTPERLLQMAASLEALSEHPLAKALTDEAKLKKLELLTIKDFLATPGLGVSGTVEGVFYKVGNAAFMQDVVTNEFIGKSEQLSRMGKTTLFVASEKVVVGLIAVSDRVKSGSVPAIRALQKLGIEVQMLTGDRRETAEALARSLGIATVVSDVLPADKERVIVQLQAQGKLVAMVGDGINDAPALTRADVGIAIGAGSDIALESADIVLMRSDLNDVVTVMQLSRSVVLNIKQNLFWAFFYNTLGIPLAAGVFFPVFGWMLSPMVAAAAMSFSSVTVVLNALRLRYFKPDATLPANMESSMPLESLQNTNPTHMKKKYVYIEGMSCAHCSARVEKALNALDGVEAKVDLAGKQAEVTLEKDVSDEALKAAVDEAGYEVVGIASDLQHF